MRVRPPSQTLTTPPRVEANLLTNPKRELKHPQGRSAKCAVTVAGDLSNPAGFKLEENKMAYTLPLTPGQPFTVKVEDSGQEHPMNLADFGFAYGAAKFTIMTSYSRSLSAFERLPQTYADYLKKLGYQPAAIVSAMSKAGFKVTL